MKYEFNSSSKNCKVNKIFFKTFLLSKMLMRGCSPSSPPLPPRLDMCEITLKNLKTKSNGYSLANLLKIAGLSFCSM